MTRFAMRKHNRNRSDSRTLQLFEGFGKDRKAGRAIPDMHSGHNEREQMADFAKRFPVLVERP